MLTNWARDKANRLYRAWAGPDPHARPSGMVFSSLSTTWRTSRSLYRRWWRSQQPLLMMLDGPPRLTGCGSITGWVLAHSDPVTSVKAYVGDRLIAETTPDHHRPDAHAAYPFYPREQRAGFRLCPTVGVVPDGIHPLRVEAVDALGLRISVDVTLTVDRFTLADTGIDPELVGSNREYQLWLKRHDQHDGYCVCNGERARRNAARQPLRLSLKWTIPNRNQSSSF